MNTTDTVKDIIQSRVDLVKDMQFRLELVHPGRGLLVFSAISDGTQS